MLIALADYAFAPDGPVHRLLGQHRAIQATIAHQFAEFVETHHGTNQTVVSLNEQRGGLGKTAAYAIVLMLDIALTGERAAYATFTRGLRNSIKEQADIFNAIVRETLEGSGITYRPVQIVELHSPTAIISPSKCEVIRKRLAAGRVPAAEMAEVRELLDCFDQREQYCEFADIYAVIPTLPAGWTELGLSLCARDRDTEDWRIIQENRAQSANSRVLILLTHAMVIRSNLRRARLFDAAGEDVFGVKTMVIDEADKLPAVANTALRFTVSRNEIVALGEEIGVLGSERKDGETRLATGLTQLNEQLTRFDVNLTKDDAPMVSIAYATDNLSQALGLLIRAATDDVLIADRLRLCRDNLRVLGQMTQFEHPIMRIALVRDPLDQPDVQITLDIGGSRRLISQMWRDEASGFETITMVSALMTNMPPFATSYSRFCRDIDLDRTKGDRFIEHAPLQPPYGEIGSVFVCDRALPLLPTNVEEANLLRVTSLDALAAQITTAAQRRMRDQRMVVLFQSYIALAEVLNRLPDDIRERVVQRNRRHLPMAIEEFADRPFGIWFGVEWEGINFVHPETKQTLVHALIITRMPLAPRDEIRASRLGHAFRDHQRGQTGALFESIHACYRKFYHGVLMGIRSEHDVIGELWILDPRWPLPTYVYQRQPPQITRSMHGGLFTYFERVVEPFDIPHWYKVDASGAVTTLL